VLPYYIGVNGVPPKLEEPLKMINCRGVILFVLFTKQSRLKVRQRRSRVCFDRFFKALQAALVIQRIHSRFARQKMGLLFLIQLAVPGWQTPAHSQPKNQDCEERAASRLKLHREILFYGAEYSMVFASFAASNFRWKK
jgi:hypothetical protein